MAASVDQHFCRASQECGGKILTRLLLRSSVRSPESWPARLSMRHADPWFQSCAFSHGWRGNRHTEGMRGGPYMNSLFLRHMSLLALAKRTALTAEVLRCFGSARPPEIS